MEQVDRAGFVRQAWVCATEYNEAVLKNVKMGWIVAFMLKYIVLGITLLPKSCALGYIAENTFGCRFLLFALPVSYSRSVFLALLSTERHVLDCKSSPLDSWDCIASMIHQ